MPHAYTEDQLVEQPATRGKTEGSMLKAEILPEVITAAVDKLTRDLLLPGLVEFTESLRIKTTPPHERHP